MKQSTYKEILNLGIPSFLEALFNTFASIIDSKMVSVMGVSAISAVAERPRALFHQVLRAVRAGLQAET